MKKLFALLILSACSLQLSAQCDHSLARVYSCAGKDIYYNSDPVRKYSVVCEMNTLLPAPTVQQVFNVSYAVNYVLEQAKVAAKSSGKDFDAIITIEGSDKDVAVKYDASSDTSKQVLTHVRRSGDKYVFVMCEPLCPYDVVKEVKAKPKFPVSIVNTVMKKVNRKKLFGKKPVYDAVIIGNDRIHYVIKFR